MSDPAIIAAIIAFFGVVLSALISLAISRRSSFIMAVTAERSKWIDKLRENIAELLSLFSAIYLMKEKNTPEADAKREKADRLIAVITMQLNPENEIDKNMIALLPNLIASVEANSDEYRGIEEEFIIHAQFLLKEEWEKVKFEAMGWILWVLSLRFIKSCKRKKSYLKFANSTP